MDNKFVRVDIRFSNEIEDIKKNLEGKISKKKISSRNITALIPKHKWWKKIKEEIIEYMCRKEVNFKD